MSLATNICLVVVVVLALYTMSRALHIAELVTWRKTSPKPYGQRRTRKHLQLLGTLAVMIIWTVIPTIMGAILLVQHILLGQSGMWSHFIVTAISAAIAMFTGRGWKVDYEHLREKYINSLNINEIE